MSDREARTLTLICDTLLPDRERDWRATVAERVQRTLTLLPNPDDVLQLRLLLRLIEAGPTALVVGGRARPFSSLSRADREVFLTAMARHPLSPVRAGFLALKRLATIGYYADVEEGCNPVWPAIGYPGPIAAAPEAPKAIDPLTVDGDTTLDCDAVIVGSGAGGGMAAAELTAAGFDVVVLEKGGYYSESDFSQLEMPMLRRLYLGAGLGTSRDKGMVLLAGSCLGGGTVVNYSTSFRTPDAVRREWDRVSGLDVFTGDEFAASLDAASRRLRVNLDHSRPSGRETVLARGLSALGWHVGTMPRDVVDCSQDDVCGYCGYGCVHGAKQSSVKTCLEDAFRQGARIVVRCEAQRISIENGRATGVIARTAEGHAVTIGARFVVVAGGAIESPALLLRSEVKGPVGRHLWLHPTTGVFGRFDEEVRPWTGTLQALYSDQLAGLDGGYGAKLETAPVHPVLACLAFPWENPGQFDDSMRALPHMSVIGTLLRDRSAGRVTLDRRGRASVRYRLSRYDRQHTRAAVEGAARVLEAAGAREIFTVQNRRVAFTPGGQETLDAWMERVDRAGYGPNRMLYVTFHQMGGCRMGADPSRFVVDRRGQSHTVRNLYVADGSLFPTASGVNPMVSIAALAHYVARQVAGA